jgi:hypothetical protein
LIANYLILKRRWKNRQVGEKWAYDDCSYLCKGLLECKTPFEVFAEMTGKDYFIRTGLAAWAMAEFMSTPSQPNSIALVASEAQPTKWVKSGLMMIVPIYAKVSWSAKPRLRFLLR